LRCRPPTKNRGDMTEQTEPSTESPLAAERARIYKEGSNQEISQFLIARDAAAASDGGSRSGCYDRRVEQSRCSVPCTGHSSQHQD
jgi:hypothetical protein